MGTLSGKFKVGEPQQYGSIYGYQKFKFPVFKTEDPISAAGYVKEELILNGKGETVGKTYYTRSFSRPNGAKRFYDSPELLVEAFGGTIDRTVPKPPKSARAIKMAETKAANLKAAEDAKAARKAKKLLKAKSPASRVKKAA